MASTEPERIQAEYLARLRRVLRRLPPEVREDAVAEVASHVADEWQALGGGLPALHEVLQRLGAPEEYGRDLALQLLLLPTQGTPPLVRLSLAGLFWASTSLIGAAAALSTALIYGFGLGMVLTAVYRLFGRSMFLIDARGYQVLTYHADRLRFPPLDWSPLAIALVGMLPALAFSAGLYRFFKAWVRSRLALRVLVRRETEQPALGATVSQQGTGLERGWEHRATLATMAIAVVSMGSCVLFTILSNLITLGRATYLELPADFFRTPLTFLTFLAALAFLGSPVLGLLWAARRKKAHVSGRRRPMGQF